MKITFYEDVIRVKEVKVDDKVYAEITGNTGIVTVIHDGAAKIKILNGSSAITDYYLKDLKVIN
jgi:hypothetical protein